MLGSLGVKTLEGLGRQHGPSHVADDVLDLQSVVERTPSQQRMVIEGADDSRMGHLFCRKGTGKQHQRIQRIVQVRLQPAQHGLCHVGLHMFVRFGKGITHPVKVQRHGVTTEGTGDGQTIGFLQVFGQQRGCLLGFKRAQHVDFAVQFDLQRRLGQRDKSSTAVHDAVQQPHHIGEVPCVHQMEIVNEQRPVQSERRVQQCGCIQGCFR